MNFVGVVALEQIGKPSWNVGMGSTRDDLIKLLKRDTEATFGKWFNVTFAPVLDVAKTKRVSFPDKAEWFACANDVDDEEEEEEEVEITGAETEFAMEELVRGYPEWEGGRREYCILTRPAFVELGTNPKMSRESALRRMGFVAGFSFKGKCCSCDAELKKQKGEWIPYSDGRVSTKRRKAVAACYGCKEACCMGCATPEEDDDEEYGEEKFLCKKCVNYGRNKSARTNRRERID